MLKKKVAAFILAAAVACPMVLASAATTVPASGKTTITPNKLTITWADNSRAAVTIDTFRFMDYNVAQLRTMVAALGGVVSSVSGGAYQLKPSGSAVAFSTISFSTAREVEYILNKTPLQNKDGALIASTEPGWVYLPEFAYNWGSIRDVATALGLTVAKFEETANGTSVVIGVAPTPTGTGNLSAGPAANPPHGGSINVTGYPTATPTNTPTPTTEPTTSSTTTTRGAEGDEAIDYLLILNDYSIVEDSANELKAVLPASVYSGLQAYFKQALLSVTPTTSVQEIEAIITYIEEYFEGLYEMYGENPIFLLPPRPTP